MHTRLHLERHPMRELDCKLHRAAQLARHKQRHKQLQLQHRFLLEQPKPIVLHHVPFNPLLHRLRHRPNQLPVQHRFLLVRPFLHPQLLPNHRRHQQLRQRQLQLLIRLLLVRGRLRQELLTSEVHKWDKYERSHRVYL